MNSCFYCRYTITNSTSKFSWKYMDIKKLLKTFTMICLMCIITYEDSWLNSLVIYHSLLLFVQLLILNKMKYIMKRLVKHIHHDMLNGILMRLLNRDLVWRTTKPQLCVWKMDWLIHFCTNISIKFFIVDHFFMNYTKRINKARYWKKSIILLMLFVNEWKTKNQWIIIDQNLHKH